MKKLYSLLLLLLALHTAHAADIVWTDITTRFVQNPDFDSGNNDGWTVNSSAGQKSVSAKIMRFWNGTFDFSQQISHLPQGTYRLTVQGFYRSQGDSYQAYKDGTERMTAFLYAGKVSKPLVSVYSEAMTSTEGNRQQHDGHYYPDNSVSAAAAFAEGLYKGNSIEFEGGGSVIIGIRCEEAESNNYCAFDNFRLEYASAADGKTWVDVTDRYLKNTGFDGDSTDGWTWDSNASSQKTDYGCMEFWNGTFDIWQTVKNAPAGQYRLSVQAYYRCKDNSPWWGGGDYQDYVNGTQNITGYLYAGDKSQQLRSVYSDPSAKYVDGTYEADGKYYPDNMYSGSVFFGEDRYWNTMDFEGGGTFNIGLRCQENEGSNWCFFDNFKLEYFTGIVKISSITISVPTTELVIGESTTATATIQPETATLPFVDWTTSNAQVATVDGDGVITAVGMGTATITATAYDGSGVKSSVTINVGHNPATAGSIVINEIMAANVDEFISPAFNFDGWIELYNPTGRAVELNDLRISDPADAASVWKMPSTMGVVPAKGYRVVWFDSNDGNPLNVPFKLDTDGGTIVISSANGQELAHQDYPAAMERVSYARSADGTGNWGMTGTPTPGSSNNGISQAVTQIDAPEVDQPSQLFTGSLAVKVTIPSGCTLRFTTDGTLPTLTNGSTSGNGRFTVNQTRSFRFRLFADGKLPSRVTTRTYLYKDKDYYLPVVSVVTDPDFLYSKEIGVMAKGPNGRPGNGKDDNCNWNMNWERPVNFSYLTADGEMVLNRDVNLEMCGGWSRAWEPHSFKLKGNKELGGDKNLPYPFFEQKPFIRNRTLQIRNGGNENNSGRLKDAALQVVLSSSGVDIDYQSYQPVHEFINGQYIGVLNVREPNNKHYVYANYGWDDDEIDLFEMSPDSGYVQKCGTPDVFNELVDVLSADAANPQTYEEICRVLDIDAYVNYMAAQMYLGGTDFPQNNVKGFRHRDGGRFRFVVFDLDFAFSTPNPFNVFFNKEDYWFDQLKPASLGRIHDRIRFVTLFKNMLQNSDFRRRFIDAYCIMGGSVFEKERSAAIIDELLDRVEPAMNLEGSSASGSAQDIKRQLDGRLSTAISALRNYSTFNLSSSQQHKQLLTSDLEGARLFINDQEIPTGKFDGQLFSPVKLRAEAPAGYAFKAWVDDGGYAYSTSSECSMPTGNIPLTATFRKLSANEKIQQNITPVRINEVSGANDSYIDEYGKKGDWVELYNTTAEPIDVEGMYLTDNANKPTKYQITRGKTNANTVIPAYGYLIVWCDNKRATTDNGLHATFKISDDGGLLMLTAADGSWTDMLTYEAHDARTTVGRYPDGAASVYTMNVATIGKRNVYTSYMTAVTQADIPSAIETTAATSKLRIVYGSGKLLVKGSAEGSVTVEVFRGDGVQVVKTSLDVPGDTGYLNIAHLPAGFYVARVSDAQGGKSSCRFVK